MTLANTQTLHHTGSQAAFGISAAANISICQTDPIKALYVDLDPAARPYMAAEQQVMAAVVQSTGYLLVNDTDLPTLGRFTWQGLARAVENTFRSSPAASPAASSAAAGRHRRRLDGGAGGASSISSEASAVDAAASNSASRALLQTSSSNTTTPLLFDLTSPTVLGSILDATVAELAAAAAAAANSSSNAAAAPPPANTLGVADPTRREAALNSMSYMQALVAGAVASGNLTTVRSGTCRRVCVQPLPSVAPSVAARAPLCLRPRTVIALTATPHALHTRSRLHTHALYLSGSLTRTRSVHAQNRRLPPQAWWLRIT